MPRKNADSISVLMPAKNAESTIELAIKSTLLALGNNSELLILLDNCTDSTELKVNKMRDSRIRIIKSSENLGVAKGLNLLAKEAKHDILARMDADDVTLPWRFVLQRRALRAWKADIVFPSHLVFGDPVSPRMRPSIWSRIRPDQAKLALCVSNPFIHAGALLTREVFQNLGGYSECPAEDYDLWIRATLSNYKVLRTATPGVLVRLHKNQVTRNPEWEKKLSKDTQLSQTLASLRFTVLGVNLKDSSKIRIQIGSKLYLLLLEHIRCQPLLFRVVLSRNLRKVSYE